MIVKKELFQFFKIEIFTSSKGLLEMESIDDSGIAKDIEKIVGSSIKDSVQEYKAMMPKSVPPTEKKQVLEWYKSEMSKLQSKERDIRNAIAQERTRLKGELLALNAMEHDLLYTASQHPMYKVLGDIKKERM